MKHFLSLAGPSSRDLHPAEVVKVASHVCELLRPEAAVRGIEILMKMPDSLPSVPADSAQLTQALVNLVINSVLTNNPALVNTEPHTGGWFYRMKLANMAVA